MPEVTAHEAVAAGEAVGAESSPWDAERWRRQDGKYRLAQGITDTFVGIDAQHPIVGGLFHGKLFLRPEAAPFTADDPGTQLRSKFRRAVGAIRIDNQDFVAKSHARQTLGELSGGVLGDQDGGNPLPGLSHLGRI
jgi:hypothetical protein